MKLLRSRHGQVVRLPEEMAFPEGVREVVIRRDGPRRVVEPIGASWDDFFDSPGLDFPPREQPQ